MDDTVFDPVFYFGRFGDIESESIEFGDTEKHRDADDIAIHVPIDGG